MRSKAASASGSACAKRRRRRWRLPSRRRPHSSAVVAGLAALFLNEMNGFDAHAALDRLDHVVDRQTRDGDGGERLHLDAGRAFDLHRRSHDAAGKLAIRRDVDGDLGQRKRVTKRDQLMRLLRRHDAGNPRRAQHVALLGVARDDQLQRRLAS